MLSFVGGDFFDYDADIMVNTVNCVGVMGAGVALAFKNRYPQMFHEYVNQCKAGKIRPGKPYVWLKRDMISKDIEIINFPTKDDWRAPSEYSYIEDGLRWLSTHLNDKEKKVVTLPALGCGHGGLEWERVKDLIRMYLSDTPADVLVFEPSSSKKADKKSLYKSYSSNLAAAGVEVIEASSARYPSLLRRYTKKNLFCYPNENKPFEYDFSLICGSKPSDAERNTAESFIELCVKYRKSILLGGSAYERKLAIECSKRGLRVGCFLPTGIYESAKKLSSMSASNKVSLLSIGDPMGGFDKKEYLPSVLSRIYISKKIIFNAARLAWLSKFELKLSRDQIVSFFYLHDGLEDEDVAAAVGAGAKKLAADFINDSVVVEDLLS